MFHMLVIPEITIGLVVFITLVFLADMIRFNTDLFIKKKRKVTFQSTVEKIHKSSIAALSIVLILCCIYPYCYYHHYNFMIQKYENEKEAERLADGFDWIAMNDSYEHDIDEQLREEKITFQESRFMKYGNVDKISIIDIIFPSKTCLKIMIFSIYLIILLGVLYSVYIQPTKSAYEYNHPQKTNILWMNILIGWTVIGWITLLMWTNPSGTSKQKQIPTKAIPPKTSFIQQKEAVEKMLQLKKLRDAGAITEEEFEQKKQEFLKQL